MNTECHPPTRRANCAPRRVGVGLGSALARFLPFSASGWALDVGVAGFSPVATPAQFPPSPTVFTCQGRLTESGQLAIGPYDLRFTLFDAVRYDSVFGGGESIVFGGQTDTGPVAALQRVKPQTG